MIGWLRRLFDWRDWLAGCSGTEERRRRGESTRPNHHRRQPRLLVFLPSRDRCPCAGAQCGGTTAGRWPTSFIFPLAAEGLQRRRARAPPRCEGDERKTRRRRRLGSPRSQGGWRQFFCCGSMLSSSLKSLPSLSSLARLPQPPARRRLLRQSQQRPGRRPRPSGRRRRWAATTTTTTRQPPYKRGQHCQPRRLAHGRAP